MISYRPSDLRAFLDELEVKPKKRLSQNFLIYGNIVRKIVKFASVQKDDLILEIGSGPGALTEALLDAGAHVIAIEKDTLFAKALLRLQTKDHRLKVIEDDVLNVIPLEILKKYEGKKTKVVSNLPYHLTTPILSKLIPFNDTFESITVMVQKEVAERFTACPGKKEYGSFTLFLRFYSSPEYGFTVEPTCFYPRPKVKSAVVQFVLHSPPQIGANSTSAVDRFFKMTRSAFQQRRKMIKTSLKDLYGTAITEAALTSLKINPQARPEDLSLEDFLRLFNIVDQRHQNV